MLGITTLEEYFSWLKTLSRIHKKYTVLPLDEEHFEINANTRAINIPASFKKNGIAVQGDDLAEILYFKIDRYFDYMDLNNTDIFIQWETPKDANGNVTRSVSPAYIRDIESEPGKLIFGWAISDAITGISGALKFSVRFFQWTKPEEAMQEGGDRTLAYSFSTLTASVNINPSIQFNPETDEFKLDDVGDRLVERIEDSEIVGGYAAAEPIFVKDLDIPNANLVYDLDPETGLYTLYIQAYSTDTGAITYTWKRQELNEDNTGDGGTITVIESTNEMVEVKDLTNLEPYYSYFITNGSDSEGNPIYTLYEGSLPPSAEDLANPAFKLYVQQSTVKADRAGIYYAYAENRITNSSRSKQSKQAKFPKPEYINITKHPDAKGILVDVSTEETPLAFEYPLGVSAGNEDGVLTYQWEMDSNYTLNFGEIAPVFTPIEGATDSIYVATEPGHYRVVITNTRNKATKVKESDISRITYAASAPVLLESGVNAATFQVDSLSDVNCPTVVMDPSVESDGYSVSWYFVEGNINAPVVENIVLEPGVLKASFNPKNYEEIILALGEQEDIDGSYYAIVTNHVNGSQASTEVPTFAEMFKVVS